MDNSTLRQSSASPAPVPKRRFGRKNIIIGLVAAGVIVIVAATLYVLHQRKFVYTDKAAVSAPLIQIAPRHPGVLKHVMVREGSTLYAGQSVARVGDEILDTQIPGIAVTVHTDIGALYNTGTPVVTMIDPDALQIVARIEEDKGLKDVHVGQRVIFTVDALGSEKFEGTVASVGVTNHEGDVVFNISDKRQTQEFDIKIDYDHEANKGFQNGMSAKVWIIK